MDEFEIKKDSAKLNNKKMQIELDSLIKWEIFWHVIQTLKDVKLVKYK